MTTAAPETHRVLVVDDESNIVDVICMALRYQGFDVASAGTGAEALSQVIDFRPQLIVLDVMLPDMEGSRSPGAWGRSARRCRSSSSPPATPPRTRCAA